MIAVCFVFAVYSIHAASANSRMAMTMDREQRQSEISQDLEEVVTSWYAEHGHTVTWSDAYAGIPGQPSGQQRFRDCRDPSGASIARVWVNSGLLRFQFFPDLFKFGSAQWIDGNAFEDLNDNGFRDSEEPLRNRADRSAYEPSSGQQLYERIGKAISSHQWAINYLYLHGITETDEKEKLRLTTNAARTLSVERANLVFELLQTREIIADYDVEALPGQFRAKFVIPYGTGDTLYKETSGIVRSGTGRYANLRNGRVDILLVIGDASGARPEDAKE
jgi:hypothetical protein